jgi:hypothetical protein
MAAIERAVRETALKLWARDQTVTEIVAKLTVVVDMPAMTPREGIEFLVQWRFWDCKPGANSMFAGTSFIFEVCTKFTEAEIVK